MINPSLSQALIEPDRACSKRDIFMGCRSAAGSIYGTRGRIIRTPYFFDGCCDKGSIKPAEMSKQLPMREADRLDSLDEIESRLSVISLL